MRGEAGADLTEQHPPVIRCVAADQKRTDGVGIGSATRHPADDDDLGAAAQRRLDPVR